MSHGWSDETERLLSEWSEKASCFRWLHARCEKKTLAAAEAVRDSQIFRAVDKEERQKVIQEAMTGCTRADSQPFPALRNSYEKHKQADDRLDEARKLEGCVNMHDFRAQCVAKSDDLTTCSFEMILSRINQVLSRRPRERTTAARRITRPCSTRRWAGTWRR